MRHVPKIGDQVGAADRGAAMLAHQPLHKRRADILILDQRADALAFLIGEGSVFLAEGRVNSIKPEHVFFTFVGVEERADSIATFQERIREWNLGHGLRRPWRFMASATISWGRSRIMCASAFGWLPPKRGRRNRPRDRRCDMR